ncbi:serine hydrolase domain-containing protein [Streptomyces sp. NPDC051567]|uniref:serine hydrolase domain-containing protein n=1 Tax=Streptomyces sp. NPDC051567 TaxID=3365660 RepID=UPI0037AE99CB
MNNDRPWHVLSRRTATGAVAAVLATAGLVGAVAPTAVAAPASAAAPVRGTPDPAARQGELRKVTDGKEATAALGRVVENGRTTWKGRAGVSDLNTSAPVDTDGRFRIGSITKTFTATTVLQLVGEGRIGLDEAIGTYLPGVVPGGDGITVRQILNHTSGIYSYTDDPTYHSGSEEWVKTGRWRAHSAQEIVAEAVKHPPYFAPGQGWHYSNTNYTLAGMLIERVTGRSWNEEVERRIVRPLHLKDTSMPGTSPFLRGAYARSYTKLASGPVDTTLINPSVAGAGGAGISSTADLARFHSALLRGKLLRPAELTEMKRTVETGLGVAYGLGIQRLDVLDNLGCGKLWGHAGGIQGNVAYVFGDAEGRRQGVTAAALYGDADAGAVIAQANKSVACTLTP